MKRTWIFGLLTASLLSIGTSDAHAAQVVSSICLNRNVGNGLLQLTARMYAESVCDKDIYDQSFVMTREADADWKVPGSRFRRAFEKFVSESDVIDLYLFGPTPDAEMWIAEAYAPLLNRKLRLVFHSGSTQMSADAVSQWSKLAQTYVGATRNELGSRFTQSFLSEWFHGEPVDQAVSQANTHSHSSGAFARGMVSKPAGFYRGNSRLIVGDGL